MDDQKSSLLGWAYYCQGKSMEELKHSLLYTSLELEQTRLAAQEEIRKRDDELINLKELLNKTLKERDEALKKWQGLFLEKFFIQQQKNDPFSAISSIEDEPIKAIDSNNGFSSSDCEESIVSSPLIDTISQQQKPASSFTEMVAQKPLPEKGKLLQAVMKAGPLLQTLLLAGPLPQWRHPPPPLESFDIPPVAIPSPPPPPPPPPQLLHKDSLININGCNRKRTLCDGSDCSTETKHRRILLH